MGDLLHAELDVTVVAQRPWGLDVRLPDGGAGLVDNTKDPSWPTGERPAAGTTLRAVVLDDDRDPVRLSALPRDREIARGRRSGDGG